MHKEYLMAQRRGNVQMRILLIVLAAAYDRWGWLMCHQTLTGTGE